MQMAEEAEVDLVEIAPLAVLLCRIMDYGKFKYQESKRRTKPSSKAEAGAGQRKSSFARERTKTITRSSSGI